MDRMHKLDSVVRETQRINSTDVGFSGSLHINPVTDTRRSVECYVTTTTVVGFRRPLGHYRGNPWLLGIWGDTHGKSF